jgi:bifunctional non-homologous end joining protein LigD
VRIDGVDLRLSNLDKALYPDGFTKGEVVDYYARISRAMLPHLRDRPATLLRFPDGVESRRFFEKNAPSYTPDWVRTARVPAVGADRQWIEYIVIDDLRTLVWCANLAALELHVPQWKVGSRGGVHDPDLMVFDLDPGAPAGIEEARRVAVWLRALLAADGLETFPKTSGKKGIHLYVPIEETSDRRTSAYARRAAERLEREHRDLVVSRMTKRLRSGKVFVDWSQNNRNKTTVAPYSLRAAPKPTVSTPVTWQEIEGDAALRFGPDEVRHRVEETGDLFAPLQQLRQRLP